MTNFEDELFYKVPCKFKFNTEAEYKKSTLINHFENWHSDEEFQDLKSQLEHQALPVVPEFVAGTIESIPDDYSAFEAFDLIKSKVETLPEENKDWLQVYNWLCEGIENHDIFALAFITRKYEVEKPQLFYLREKNTGYYLNKSKNNGLELVPNPYFDEDNQFTKQEIDSMQTGSYELVPVEDGE